jgi:hypothetical protein
MIRVNLTRALPIFTKSSRLPSLKSLSWSGTQKCRDRHGCARRKKSHTHQATISTLSEGFLQNHASPSRLLTTRKPKNVACLLFSQARPSARLCFLLLTAILCCISTSKRFGIHSSKCRKIDLILCLAEKRRKVERLTHRVPGRQLVLVSAHVLRPRPPEKLRHRGEHAQR